MLIRIVGSSSEAGMLFSRVQDALEELGLSSHAVVEKYDTPEYRSMMKIDSFPALCLEESSIDFRDTIFQGLVPEQKEIVNLFISLFGTEEGKKTGCATCAGGCDSCAC